jgi:crotonobetainyl-CoA:carnitine CoA-transferase CaiB-like acyl-CoA transferase
MDLIHAPELKCHTTNALRVAHQEVIDAAITKWTQRQSLRSILSQLDAAQIPVGPIHPVQDMATEPHFQARHMFEHVTIPGHAHPLHVPSISPKLSGTPGATKWPGKPLGSDTRWCLSHVLGLSSMTIEQLISDNIVFVPSSH